MLKRFWSGEMTNAKIEAELRIAQPEMLLLMSDTNPRAFRDLIATEYRLVYQDPSHRLYIRNSIADKVDL
jgi:type II secretory pathway predicted ATPase ExeA